MKRKTSNRDYARVLLEISKIFRGEKLQKALRQFVLLLFRGKKLKQTERIVQEFISQAKKEEGIREIEITSAHPLTSAALTYLKKIFGEKAEIHKKENSALLGGVRIQCGGQIFDASIKTQINKFKAI
ncbi:MAG: ATP synthase F1 subunit delta [Candidatus Magasanikbacteria bacterium]|nr:ATP synthase F1 subunit delta [Candidatus Magasanikbacteria bacterium]